MKKYLSEDEVKEYLNKQKKFAEEEQRKNRCDEQQDAYWQGYIDIIDTIAEDFNLEPLWC